MGVNFQNIPIRTETGKEVRNLFIAAPGNRLIVSDLEAIEYRLLAHFSQEDVLLNSFINGLDVHQQTANKLKVPRDVGKTFTYGVCYGAAPPKISQILQKAGHNYSVKDCKKLQQEFEAALPKVTKWKAQVLAQANATGQVQTLAGRVRHLQDLYSTDKSVVRRAERQAINSLIQGSAADILQVATVELYKQGFVPLLTVHDELVYEVPEDEAEDIAAIVKKEMEAPFSDLLTVPIEAKAGVYERWGEAK